MACGCGQKKDRSVSIRKKAYNASGAFKRAAYAFVRGQPVFSTEELAQARMKVCMRCERRRSRDNECMACGCKVERKVKLNTESCPVGKWDAVVK